MPKAAAHHRQTPAAQAAAELAGHDFKGLRDPVEVFKAGTHTDSKGREATFTQADLDQMVANVSGAGVPAVLGHPKDTDPAYAWAKLRREGDLLLAEFADINPDFEAAVDAGAYRERSISVFKDPARGWVPQHIGWLGAVAPALALKPLQYSGGARAAAPQGAEVLTFSADEMATGWALGDVARMLRGLRDWLISDKGLDLADKVLPDWTITSIADAGRRVSDAAMAENTPQALGPTFNAATAAGVRMPQNTTTTPAANAVTMTEAEAQALREQAASATALQAQFSAASTELAALRAQQTLERIGVQVSGWKAAGLLTPAEEPGLTEFMAALETGQAAEFNFNAADKTAAKKTPAQWFAEFMAARKPIKLGRTGGALVEGDVADTLDTQDARAITRAAQEFMHAEAQAGRVVSVAQAVVHVTTKAGASKG